MEFRLRELLDKFRAHVTDSDPHTGYVTDAEHTAWRQLHETAVVSAAANIGTSESAFITKAVTIPASWLSWRASVIASVRVRPLSVAGVAAAASRGLNIRAKRAATAFGQEQIKTLLTTTAHDLFTYSAGTTADVAGVTGAVTFGVYGELGAADNYRIEDANLQVVVTRVS